MNRIYKNVSFLLATIIGILTIGAFYFFYSEQKKFSINQKEFLLHLNAIQTSEAKLEYTLLQNYIYAYNNYDEITDALLRLEQNFDNLRRSKILTLSNYAAISSDIDRLSQTIEQLFIDTQRFMMLNASIKNSLIFLTSFERFFSQESDRDLFLRAAKAIRSFLYARRLNDLSFVRDTDLLPLRKAHTSQEATFIETFNKHVEFLQKTFPTFFRYNDKIKNNRVYETTQRIKRRFSSIALQDVRFLNRFSIVLFSIFTFTYLYLLVVLVKYVKEHDALEKTTRSLRYSYTHDVLTGLKNRVAFENDKKNLKSASVVLLNIDRFKDINDAFGNDIGDKTLLKIAHLLRSLVRNVSEVVDIYRVGGDEFCILLRDNNQDKAVRLATRIVETISHQDLHIEQNDINLSLSAAVNNVSPLLENADLALKYGKKQDNKKVFVYKPELRLPEAAKNNVQTLNIVRRALNENTVEVYFQPIVNLKTDTIEKHEALVRIRCDDTILSPGAFLEISKKTPLYYEITRKVIEKTIQTAGLYPQYRFSINLSMADLLNDVLIENLFRLFEDNIAVAGRIDIELLESEHLHDIDRVKRFIDRLHSFGSLVLIDDFGSGYSNFSYFGELEIDVVKIDGSIINEITTNKRKLHMLESIVMFSRGMHVKIVAEYVDNIAIVKELKRLHIDYAQGFYFAKPQPEPLLRLPNNV